MILSLVSSSLLQPAFIPLTPELQSAGGGPPSVHGAPAPRRPLRPPSLPAPASRCWPPGLQQRFSGSHAVHQRRRVKSEQLLLSVRPDVSAFVTVVARRQGRAPDAPGTRVRAPSDLEAKTRTLI